jgi:hypothetical protein
MKRGSKLEETGSILCAPINVTFVILGTYRNITLSLGIRRKNCFFCANYRRASLDAFWAREPSTVRANLRGAG